MLTLLRRILGPLVEIISAIIKAVASGKSLASSTGTLPEGPPVQPPAPEEAPQTPAEGPPVEVEATPVPAPAPTPAKDPNRKGTFIITDIYPRDFAGEPPYQNIVGREFANGKEVVGVILKASEATGWGAGNEAWFKRQWAKVKAVGGQRYGVDWFRGAYHFLRFSVDGAKQADYYLRLIDQAGGWDSGDIMPIVDAEEGGQGSWAGGQKLADVKDPAKRAQLKADVIRCVSQFAERVKSATGMPVMLYGRGVQRDLGINDRMHCDAVWNPAWTRNIVPMDKYGWPIDKMPLWQLCGDGVVAAEGFPSDIPGWPGGHDYSVYIDGPNKTDLVSLRRRLLAKPR